MKILVNALACRVAGARTVAMNFLRCYSDGDFDHELVVYAPARCGYEALEAPNVHIHLVPNIVHRALARPWVDNVWMKRILEDVKPDVMFALGSIATMVGVSLVFGLSTRLGSGDQPRVFRRVLSAVSIASILIGCLWLGQPQLASG